MHGAISFEQYYLGKTTDKLVKITQFLLVLNNKILGLLSSTYLIFSSTGDTGTRVRFGVINERELKEIKKSLAG